MDLPTVGFSLDCSVDLSLAVPKTQTSIVLFPQFGVYEEFYLNGNVAIQANFEAGLLEGACLVFDMDGGIVANLNFHLGQLVGMDLSTSQLDMSMDMEMGFDFDLDTGGAFASSKPMATVKDHIPNLNIRPFGMCKSQGNPAVKAAGKPAPCTPKTETSWIGGSTLHVSNKNTNMTANAGTSASAKTNTDATGQARVLNDSSVLACAYGCVITVLDPGQSTITVP